MYYYRVSIKGLIDEFSYDYFCYNNLPNQYQIKIHSSIKACVAYSEKAWNICLAIAVATFPLMSILTTMYSQLFDEVPKKYMIHDLNKPFAEPEERFESPFYEIVYVFMMGSAIIWYVNYSGEYFFNFNNLYYKYFIKLNFIQYNTFKT
uniref:Odorant receptor n=1 Tax=Leucinodes orbonalis TaxID=711050 RepID=A0AAU0QMP6_9NEOP|nr:odorant receptor [Leucinodes orbonalis]